MPGGGGIRTGVCIRYPRRHFTSDTLPPPGSWFGVSRVAVHEASNLGIAEGSRFITFPAFSLGLFLYPFHLGSLVLRRMARCSCSCLGSAVAIQLWGSANPLRMVELALDEQKELGTPVYKANVGGQV